MRYLYEQIMNYIPTHYRPKEIIYFTLEKFQRLLHIILWSLIIFALKITSVFSSTCKKLYVHIWFSIYFITHLFAWGLPIGSGRNMYLFIYNKKEAGELMTKQNQMDITIHEVVSTHAYFHYKPELSINTKHIHKHTHTHIYNHTLIDSYIHSSIH